MFCKQCGATVSDRAVRCDACGVDFRGTMPPPPPPAPPDFAPPRGAPSPAAAYPPPARPVYFAAAPVHVQRSRTTAGLLGIFLGGLGAHRFYLGHVGIGIAQLVLSILTSPFCIPLGAVWGFVEGIVILSRGINTDSRGVPLRD